MVSVYEEQLLLLVAIPVVMSLIQQPLANKIKIENEQKVVSKI
jgi:hypothetical protein